MFKLNADIKCDNIQVTAHFDNQINILEGDSGSGKTVVINQVNRWCMLNNINVEKFNYNHQFLGDKAIIELCKNSEVILFDNADLYMTDEILDYCRKNNKLVIMSIKNIARINTEDAAFYIVINNSGHFTTEKL